MRKRTPTESAAYFREYRARKKAAAGAPATPSPKKGATPARRNTQPAASSPVIATPTPCASCAAHAAALTTAQERISLLVSQLATARRTTTATPSAHIGKADDAEALLKRVLAEKVNRISSFSRGHVIGSARI